MSSRHLTVHLDDDTFERLEAHRRRAGQTRSELGRTLLDEVLRMEDHPGIVFRSGPGGRRAGLAGGPDVWEVIRAVQDARTSDTPSVEALDHAAMACGVTTEQVRTALRYYSAFRQEIDEWLDRLDGVADRAEAAWQRGRALLGR